MTHFARVLYLGGETWLTSEIDGTDEFVTSICTWSFCESPFSLTSFMYMHIKWPNNSPVPGFVVDHKIHKEDTSPYTTTAVCNWLSVRNFWVSYITFSVAN